MTTFNIYTVVQRLIDLGLSQEYLASASGLSQGRISQIIKGLGKTTCAYENGRRLEALLERFDSEKSA